MDKNIVFRTNYSNYNLNYSRKQSFLKYPADWIIRFHDMYLKRELPTGKVLDFGCGSGNNSIFFVEKGYDVYGIDIAEAALPLIEEVFKDKNLKYEVRDKFKIISPDSTRLPFEDNFFDFILSNQVLYFFPSQESIKDICREFLRCLRPGGIVFFTMMGPKNYYIKEYTKKVHNGKIHEVAIKTPGHRLDGLRQYIYLVENENELKKIFSDFKCISTGYFDQKMFELTSNFHWIFIGKK